MPAAEFEVVTRQPGRIGGNSLASEFHAELLAHRPVGLGLDTAGSWSSVQLHCPASSGVMMMPARRDRPDGRPIQGAGTHENVTISGFAGLAARSGSRVGPARWHRRRLRPGLGRCWYHCHRYPPPARTATTTSANECGNAVDCDARRTPKLQRACWPPAEAVRQPPGSLPIQLSENRPHSMRHPRPNVCTMPYLVAAECPPQNAGVRVILIVDCDVRQCGLAIVASTGGGLLAFVLTPGTVAAACAPRAEAPQP